MHVTEVELKSGEKFSGSMGFFRPFENYFTLHAGIKTMRFKFSDCNSVTTLGERLSINQIGDCDEIERARKFLINGRKYKWSEDGVKAPEQKFDWE